MKSKLQEAIILRENNQSKEALNILEKLLIDEPLNGPIYYQSAWCCDNLSLEKEAINYYQKAIKFGLNQTDLKEAYLGLGSTYRAIGEYILAKETFLKGIDCFPENNAYRVFLAMVYYNLGEYQKGMELLLQLLATTSSDNDIQLYQKAITYYSTRLEDKW